MSQVNVSPEGRDTGVGTVLAILLVLVLVAFLVWALAFGGFNTLAGRPAVNAPATSPGNTVNINPNVNVNPAPGKTGDTSGGTTAPSGGTTAPSGGTAPAPKQP
ncbi:MAG TPA: hypothetical protein VG370_28650 [Chloroflexota bacterium]|nr:hypothetical protein [Chloroflexota bacterium]